MNVFKHGMIRHRYILRSSLFYPTRRTIRPLRLNLQPLDPGYLSRQSPVTRDIRRHLGSTPMERSSKRVKVTSDLTLETEGRQDQISTPLNSLHRSISPPLRTRSQGLDQSYSACPELANDKIETEQKNVPHSKRPGNFSLRLIPSPVQLTHIRDYPASKGYNNDAVRLRDILGDPMIRECWQFNYMFDVDFLMSQFDEDVRSLVTVKVVHGSWRKESPNRMMIDVNTPLFQEYIYFEKTNKSMQEGCSRYPNVEPIVAYMPDPFGTHHSKMMILLRHDDLAQ